MGKLSRQTDGPTGVKDQRGPGLELWLEHSEWKKMKHMRSERSVDFMFYADLCRFYVYPIHV